VKQLRKKGIPRICVYTITDVKLLKYEYVGKYRYIIYLLNLNVRVCVYNPFVISGLASVTRLLCPGMRL